MPMRALLLVTVGAFSAGELVQALRLRRGSTPVDVRAEVVFRVMFFGAILMLPVGRAVAPGVVLGGGVWLFAVGAVLRWLGLRDDGSVERELSIARQETAKGRTHN